MVGGIVAHVEPGTPADDAGFYPGCVITAADGHELRDVIDWRWHAAGNAVTVSYVDADGDAGDVELMRDGGEPWGIEFSDPIFDGVRECRNACTFCFMRQLPEDVRATLTLRDDDYRLSFLQGNFVTFTNMTPADEARVIGQRISPLRFSLHCISPEMRERIIGKHAGQGLRVARRLLDAGIELHVQIVLMPGVNDGDELRRTIEWCYERPGILDVGIVPLGFTKHQERFDESFNDAPRAREVIELVEPYQRRAMRERGHGWVHVSDEFYRNAYPDTLLEHVPSAKAYGDFGMFEDGIGIVRSFIDDWNASGESIDACADLLESTDRRVLLVYGCAMREVLGPLLASSRLSGRLIPLFVANDYFGGNVDVTGLLCGCDVVPAVRGAARRMREEEGGLAFAVIPAVAFNDDGVMLDDMSLEQLRSLCGIDVHVVSCEASIYLRQIAHLLRR
jgi:putative radical SAM enzyme (TIGR03279 family)